MYSRKRPISIAIVFYGIGRGGEKCKQNFKKNLLDSLESFCDLSLYEFRDNIDFIDNNRSNERGAIDIDKFYFSHSCKVKVDTNTDELKREWNLSKKYIDVHSDNYVSNKNLLKQLLLLKAASQYLEKEKLKPDIVFAIRDDILWKSKVNLKPIVQRIIDEPKTYFTGRFYWNGGVNERFFMSSYQGAELILNRVDELNSYYEASSSLGYVKTEGLNAEWLMRFLLEKYRFNILAVKVVTPRVRLGGRIRKDILLPRPWRFSCYMRALLANFRYIRLSLAEKFSVGMVKLFRMN